MLANRVQLVDVRALRHQRPRRLLLGFEGNTIGRQRHQRGSSTREQHHQDIVLSISGSILERTARALRLPSSGNGWPAHRTTPPLLVVMSDGGSSRTNSEHVAQTTSVSEAKAVSIRSGGLAGSDDVHGIARVAAFRRYRWGARGGPGLRRSQPIGLRQGSCRDGFEGRKRRSVHLPGIGPGRPPGHEINLLQNVAHDLIGLVLFAQLIELGHDLCERSFDIADRALGVILPLRVETALATNEFFSVEIGKGDGGPDRKAEANLSGSGTSGSSTLASPPFRKV